MRDSFSPSPEPYFSERDFSELRESQDAVLVRVADVLKRDMPLIESQLMKRGLREQGSDGLCQIATSMLDQQFKAAGFDSQILEGDLVIAPHQTLEHRVNWVRTSDHWAVIDLTIDQIPQHKNKRILVKIVPPNSESLKQMLQAEYRWWFRDEQK